MSHRLNRKLNISWFSRNGQDLGNKRHFCGDKRLARNPLDVARSLVVVLDKNSDCFECIESISVVLWLVVDEEIGEADQLVICQL